ncbi:uncharacterized protein EDB91DRAFT_1108446 [Suillus paluster]|uniref:uncharacterized protein n=1 Tax=Suillus paluster TaxID=48578 RepID=UPI001B87B75E|nr:uncharacterized protein EDB91DRAFT_1108446 [Suillus paluster]KAG1750620.1 hypothetical protein EDB91DRAFT_1108446 [Suillus paluster]
MNIIDLINPLPFIATLVVLQAREAASAIPPANSACLPSHNLSVAEFINLPLSPPSSVMVTVHADQWFRKDRQHFLPSVMGQLVEAGRLSRKRKRVQATQEEDIDQ